jgi:ribonuclease P protein component
MGRRFLSAEHIRRRADFEGVYRRGFKGSGRLMTVFVRFAEGPSSRLGIAATRKLGGAVVRNRAKRLIRELFRHNKPPRPVDVVVVPRRELLDAPYAHLEAEFRTLVTRGTSAQPRRADRPQLH